MVGCSKIHDGRCGRTNAPHTSINGSILQSIGSLNKGKPVHLEGLVRHTHRRKHQTAHILCSTTGSTYGNPFAFEILKLLDTAVLQGNHVINIGIHDKQGVYFLSLAFEPSQSVVGFISNITHNLGNFTLSPVNKLHILHRGTGNLSHSVNILNVPGPDLRKGTAVGIVNAARSSGSYGYEPLSGLGIHSNNAQKHGKHCQKQPQPPH